jgi:hypothetical protein
MLPIHLECLHSLRINFSSSDGMDDDLVPAIALLLHGLSNLQDLHITCWNDPKCEAYFREKVPHVISYVHTNPFNDACQSSLYASHLSLVYFLCTWVCAHLLTNQKKKKYFVVLVYLIH